jgi:hypothetical protein
MTSIHRRIEHVQNAITLTAIPGVRSGFAA